MKEKWIKYKTDINIPTNITMKWLLDYSEALCITFEIEDKLNSFINVTFDAGVLVYRNRDESDFLKKMNFLTDNYGSRFYIDWRFFKVTNSEFIHWFVDQNYNMFKVDDILHFVFITNDEVIEVLSFTNPKVTEEFSAKFNPKMSDFDIDCKR